MKKLIIPILMILIMSCEDDNCEDKRDEINARYAELILKADEEQTSFLIREREQKLRTACD